MLFNSAQFFVFFPLVTIAYFVLPHRYRWIMLLIASCYFYMAFIPIYILILFFTILVDYSAGILIEDAPTERRQFFLIGSILANIGVLVVFKYFNFLSTNLANLGNWLGWNYPIHVLAIILPLGLSFHTFQSLSYTIEVYRGRQKAERHPGIFALYVMFYPQLVAGPIERPYNLLHQFHEVHRFEYQRVTDGLKLMTWGLFKKVVIADRLAVTVNQVYNDPTHYDGLALIIATVFFAYQIYCDFSGYSDIALGSAQVMGFDLMKNFNRPYAAQSLSEFWKRWHISLSTWFRDYVYIPLGGNRVSQGRWQLNILITFLLSGLWHGANWTFIVWGALHGLYQLVSFWASSIMRASRLRLERVAWLRHSVSIVTTFAVVTFAWIFFRAKDLSDAFYIVMHLYTGIDFLITHPSVQTLKSVFSGLGMSGSDLLILLASVGILEVVQFYQGKGSVRLQLASKPIWFRWALYYGLVCSIILFGNFGNNQFIYFQF